MKTQAERVAINYRIYNKARIMGYRRKHATESFIMSHHKGFWPMFEMNVVQELYDKNLLGSLYEYLWSFYGSWEKYDAYLKRGFRDPCLNLCLSKTAFFKNKNNRKIIEENWTDIMHAAFYRFFTKFVKEYDSERFIKFGTFLNATLGSCFQYEFLEYTRPEVIEKNEILDTIYTPIEEFSEEQLDELIGDEDVQLYDTHPFEFAALLKRRIPYNNDDAVPEDWSKIPELQLPFKSKVNNGQK